MSVAPAAGQPPGAALAATDVADEALLRWPLPPGAEGFAAIDGRRCVAMSSPRP